LLRCGLGRRRVFGRKSVEARLQTTERGGYEFEARLRRYCPVDAALARQVAAAGSANTQVLVDLLPIRFGNGTVQIPGKQSEDLVVLY
jgi:hypothetical protein